MYGRNQWGSLFILARPPPKTTRKTETPGGSRVVGLPSGALYTEGGPRFGTTAGLYPAEGTGLCRLSSILPPSAISLYQIGGLPC